MTPQEVQNLIDRYEERFHNGDDFILPQIIDDPRLHTLMEEAIKTGEKVKAVIPDVGWEF